MSSYVNEIRVEPRRLVLMRGGVEQELNALWLRQHVAEPDARDALTGQRFHDPHALSPDLAVAAIEAGESAIAVTFSDGYRSRFSLDDLLSLCTPADGLPVALPWTAAAIPAVRHDWLALEHHDDALFDCLCDFFSAGFVILHNTPTAPQSILEIAARFGIVRTTNFGALFDVVSNPLSNDLAFRAGALAPHTDNPYRNPVPGVQLLHCLVNETTGGLSTLVDGLAVCEEIADEDAGALDLLTSIPVEFAFRDSGNLLRDRHPLVTTDADGCVTGIHYSPRLDLMPLLSADTQRAFHRARQLLGQKLASSRFEYRFLLGEGELAMFDNNRVLHGRTAFDPEQGMRRLQGCYIDRDGPSNRYRVLSRRAAIGRSGSNTEQFS